MSLNEIEVGEQELEEERLSRELSLEQKRAMLREAKHRYGKDYMRFFSKFTGKGSGIDWGALRFRL